MNNRQMYEMSVEAFANCKAIKRLEQEIEASREQLGKFYEQARKAGASCYSDSDMYYVLLYGRVHIFETEEERLIFLAEHFDNLKRTLSED